MIGRSSLKTRFIPSLRTDACAVVAAGVTGVLVLKLPIVRATPMAAATAIAAAATTTTYRRPRRWTSGAGAATGSGPPSPALEGPRSSAGASSASCRPPARSPQKSSALGGASEAAKLVGATSSGGRSGSWAPGLAGRTGPARRAGRSNPRAERRSGARPYCPLWFAGLPSPPSCRPFAGVSASSRSRLSGLGGIVHA